MPQNNFSYEFATYRVDVAQRVLTRSGESIPLPPKATEVLLILLDKAGQLVEKDLLLNQIWPDSFVEENNLTQCIFTLRRALQEDSSGPKFIETVARRGFRFVAPVKKIPAPTVAVEQEPFTIPTRLPVLAVLKFINATGDVELQYLAEGIPETLINNFSGLSQLRVISRSTAFRYKSKQVDLQTTGHKLGADVLLVGQIATRESALSVSVELVGVNSGWQLWGETFLVDSSNIFEIQDEITRQILRALNLPLSGEEEKRVAKRYTENVAAYQAYLEGRYHWSRYSRTGIERAIGHFGKAIELDPNYALAYAGIVDCYLRLATNYLPPEDGVPLTDEAEPDGLTEDRNPAASALVGEHHLSSAGESTRKRVDSIEQAEGELLTDGKVKLRHEWDWKGAERELRRANELRTDYPAAHQWHAAYVFARDCFHETQNELRTDREVTDRMLQGPIRWGIPIGITPTERAQVFCTVAREQIDSGNYDAACDVLKSWWVWGRWPVFTGLRPETCGDLLLTTGTLAGSVASSRQIPQGQKHAEALLNGAIALFESFGARGRVAEAQIELALCYYRQGLFDLGRRTFTSTLSNLSEDDRELRSLCLIRLASLERHSGRPQAALVRLNEAEYSAGLSGPWATGRCHLEYASTFKDLAELESPVHYDSALTYYRAAQREFEAIGNHRLAAICENNLGFMLINLDLLKQAESHLLRAQQVFTSFRDKVLGAQVNDSLARLYLVAGKLELANEASALAVSVLEKGDEDALLADTLSTHATTLNALGRRREGKRILERAYQIAERCGDLEGAGRALLIMIEQMLDCCDGDEQQELRFRVAALMTRGEHLTNHKRLQDAAARLQPRSVT